MLREDIERAGTEAVGVALARLDRVQCGARFQIFEAVAGDDQRAAWAKGPMIIEKTGDVGLYLVPPVRGRGMKVGDHEFSRSGDPDGGREAQQEEIRPLLERCRSLFKGFDGWRADRLKVCFYTVTGDERFVVEKTGAKGWVMSPCSGHGFKFGALMGLELARTIATDRDPLQHARWAAGLEGE